MLRLSVLHEVPALVQSRRRRSARGFAEPGFADAALALPGGGPAVPPRPAAAKAILDGTEVGCPPAWSPKFDDGASGADVVAAIEPQKKRKNTKCLPTWRAWRCPRRGTALEALSKACLEFALARNDDASARRRQRHHQRTGPGSCSAFQSGPLLKSWVDKTVRLRPNIGLLYLNLRRRGAGPTAHRARPDAHQVRGSWG